MTCIFVGRISKNKLAMVADRRIAYGGSGLFGMSPVPKIIKIGRALIGYCGMVALRDVFFGLKELDNLDKTNDITGYINRHLIPAYRKKLISLGYMHKERLETDIHAQDSADTSFLLAIDNRVFEINASVNVVSVEQTAQPVGIGCGAELALGIYTALDKYSQVPNRKQMLIETLKTVAQLNAGCDDNIDIIY